MAAILNTQWQLIGRTLLLHVVGRQSLASPDHIWFGGCRDLSHTVERKSFAKRLRERTKGCVEIICAQEMRRAILIAVYLAKARPLAKRVTATPPSLINWLPCSCARMGAKIAAKAHLVPLPGTNSSVSLKSNGRVQAFPIALEAWRHLVKREWMRDDFVNIMRANALGLAWSSR